MPVTSRALAIRVDDATRAAWQKAADDAGMSLSDWIRAACKSVADDTELGLHVQRRLAKKPRTPRAPAAERPLDAVGVPADSATGKATTTVGSVLAGLSKPDTPCGRRHTKGVYCKPCGIVP